MVIMFAWHILISESNCIIQPERYSVVSLLFPSLSIFQNEDLNSIPKVLSFRARKYTTVDSPAPAKKPSN